MRAWVGIVAMAVVAVPAAAQQSLPKPDVVLLPRDVAQSAMAWIATPDPTVAVRLFSALQACVGNNPQDGRVVRQGQDQCPVVTEALAARDKEIEDLKRQLAEAKKPPEKKD